MKTVPRVFAYLRRYPWLALGRWGVRFSGRDGGGGSGGDGEGDR
jgi:hypothetical protein